MQLPLPELGSGSFCYGGTFMKNLKVLINRAKPLINSPK